ncbi:hypothetical protein ACH5A3_43865 [Streptomyces echinatus]|uniref:hypothetical protein n=1 Tax=Streptomyces echinatus TaxID=67293 RepID=UPI003798E03C
MPTSASKRICRVLGASRAGCYRHLATGPARAERQAEEKRLDEVRESRLVAEDAMDRIRAKFGPGAVGPAATLPFRRAS